MTNLPLKPHFCDELLLAFSLNRIIRDVMNNVTKQCDEFNSPHCFITFGNCCVVEEARNGEKTVFRWQRAGQQEQYEEHLSDKRADGQSVRGSIVRNMHMVAGGSIGKRGT
jgi:hypothetical protein